MPGGPILETWKNNKEKYISESIDEILTDIIRRKSEAKDVEKVVLLIGNDFLNADNLQGTTARHFTPQDQETNWYEMITGATRYTLKINGQILVDTYDFICSVEVNSNKVIDNNSPVSARFCLQIFLAKA